jgi:glyoxylase-like metal-dependent hydrolase (beta-lactamase superfamily II)
MIDQHSLPVAEIQNWLETGQPVTILDVRPLAERREWAIPGSQHADVYDRLKTDDPEALRDVALPADRPVVVVCAAGRTSVKAAALLRQRGIEAWSMAGGMKAWSLAWNTAEVPTATPGVVVRQFRRVAKGCLSYLLVSDGEALVVDPSLDPGVYQSAAADLDSRIRYVLDTHLHADHLSRARLLAGRTGARLLLPANPALQFDYEPVTVATVLRVGAVSLRAIPTPGHTTDSFCYALDEDLLLTGDTLFVEGIGRPDLKADAAETRRRARLLRQSLAELLALSEFVAVLPGHSSQPVAFDGQPVMTTIGTLREQLTWLRLPEEEFVQTLIERIPPTPPNYQAISDWNKTGDFSGIDPTDLEAGANRCAVS